MKEKILNTDIGEFLKDFEKESTTEILEEGKEKKEIISIAKAKGIDLKKNKDLAGFKTIYTFANKANANKARLPKQKLLKALPTMISKPVDVDHIRSQVIGHYIDYRYVAKDEKVIAYGVFYKSNFGKLWKEAKKLFKAGKLTTSYEIWCPENRRKFLSDGTYELLEIEIAGGALLFKEEPAFEDAKVLELAKKNTEKELDLVFASRYKDNEIIIAEDIWKKSVEKNYEEMQKEKQTPKQEKVEAPKVEPKLSQPADNKEVTEVKPKEQKPEIIKPKCSNCEIEIESTLFLTTDKVKCSKCKAIIDKTGKMIYPPQNIDFKLLCPACKISNNWLILANKELQSDIKCLSCQNEYVVDFKKAERIDSPSEIVKTKVNFLYVDSTSCPQCSTRIPIVGSSLVEKHDLKCSICGLEFTYDKNKIEKNRQILKISEKKKSDTILKSSKKGGTKDMEFKLELSKYHRYFEGDLEKFKKEVLNDELEVSEKAKQLTTQERQTLPDDMFAVVVRVRNKVTDEMRKIRKYPINDEAHVRNTLARLAQPQAQTTLKKLGVSIESVRAKILSRARQLKMTQLLERYKKASNENIELKKKIEVLKAKLETATSEVAKIKKNTDEKISFYKDNAVEITKRREELGEEFSNNLSDKDILNDDKYARTLAEKENNLLKAKIEGGTDIVADKDVLKDEDWFKNARKKINEKAFGKKK